jgi:hypothetical protein
MVLMKTAEWMKGPEEKRTNLGVWSEVSGPLKYRPILLLTIAVDLSRPEDARGGIWPINK